MSRSRGACSEMDGRSSAEMQVEHERGELLHIEPAERHERALSERSVR